MASLHDFLPIMMFLLGFDSFLGGIAVGTIVSSWRGRVAFVLMFGICDGVASLLGAAVPHLVPEPPAAAIYLIAVVLIIQGARRSRAWLYAMPVLFSIDNLAAGNSAADAPVLALSSAAMAAAGIALGAFGRRMTIHLAAPRAVG
jgi:hypothetical protein